MIDMPSAAAEAPAPTVEPGQALVDAVVAQGPSGAFAVAGIATGVVVALYFAFYFFAYLPRGAIQ